MLVLLLCATGAGAWASDCADLPPPSKDIALERYYRSDSKSVVDPEKQARHAAEVAPLRAFLRQVSQSADASWQAGSPAAQTAAGRCAIAALIYWAEGRAYLGHIGSKQAEYQRKWDLAGLALAYLKVRHHARPAEHETISAWLTEISVRADRFQRAPGRAANNHAYWLALGVGAVALATRSDALWQTASDWFGRALSDIADDGTLPLELVRGERALHYHVYSVMPLIALAELAEARGENWYARQNGALHRLVSVTVAGLKDPVQFDRRAGVPQERPVVARAGWAYLYDRRFPRNRFKRAGISLELTRKTRHRLFGGDVRVLLDALAKPR